MTSQPPQRDGCCGASCGCGAGSLGGALQPPAILLVDDDPDFLEWLTDAVKARGKARVLKARSAQTALTTLREDPGVVLLVTDHYMDPHDGIDLLEAALQARPDVRRVIMTGRPRSEVFIGGINRGQVQHYLPKLSNPRLMIDAVIRQLHIALGLPVAPIPSDGRRSTGAKLCG